jgi:taurine--2-oxoglutarate transaminase
MTLTVDSGLAAEIRARDRQYVLHPWATQSEVNAPIMVGAKGCTLWDADGREYLDFSSQLCNVNLGFGDQRVVDAIAAQARELAYVSPIYLNAPQARLAEQIAAVAPGDLTKSFFTVGGSEANEVAIQLARLYTGRQKIITSYRGYHGATYGGHSLSGGVARNASGFGIPGVVHALWQDCYRCPFGQTYPGCKIECAEQYAHLIELEDPKQVAAIMIEPIRVGDGVQIPPPEFLPRLREICDRYDVLLILDEIVTGFGRTGRWFACEHWDVVPDIITLAKGMNSGYAAVGAVTVNRKLADYFEDHFIHFGFTNGGQPLAFAAASAVIDAYHQDGLVERSARLGELLLAELREMQARHPSLGDVRGLGIMAALELTRDSATREPLLSPIAPVNYSAPSPVDAFKERLLERGLIAPLRGSTLRVYPPLCVTEAELRRGLEIVDEALELTDLHVTSAGSRSHLVPDGVGG